jgi:hypothetical protein
MQLPELCHPPQLKRRLTVARVSHLVSLRYIHSQPEITLERPIGGTPPPRFHNLYGHALA